MGALQSNFDYPDLKPTLFIIGGSASMPARELMSMKVDSGPFYPLHPLGNREFKKLRRLRQRKRHIKIELCVMLNVLRLFHVCHVIRNRRSARIIFM